MRTQTSKKKSYQFRITCEYAEMGNRFPSVLEFKYKRIDQARRNYTAILLDMYRKKTITSYRICLNRLRSERWEAPIFQDAGGRQEVFHHSDLGRGRVMAHTAPHR